MPAALIILLVAHWLMAVLWACRTALILGCEHSCKEAVDVLLRAGADVGAVDCFGHDSYYYARICKNPELVVLIRNAVESAAKGKGWNPPFQRICQTPHWHINHNNLP